MAWFLIFLGSIWKGDHLSEIINLFKNVTVYLPLELPSSFCSLISSLLATTILHTMYLVHLLFACLLQLE